MSSCNDVSINNLVVLLKNVLNLIQIIGPILCIISLIVIFIKIINKPNEKKYDKYIKNITISLLVLFFIPMSINVLMDILGDNNTFTSCWNNSNEFIDSNTKYMNIEEKDKNGLLVDPNS